MENVIIVLILLTIVSAILFYLIRAKAQGVACIGCPHGKQCCENSGVDRKADSGINSKASGCCGGGCGSCCGGCCGGCHES